MKIFEKSINQLEKNSAPSDGVSKKTGKSKRNDQSNRTPKLSTSEVREKIGAHLELSRSSQEKAKLKNQEKLGAGFLNSEKENNTDPNFPDKIMRSDVGLNSPDDSNTKEKLKSALSMGAFNFNSKEREVLDRILKDS
jgi:hypothetical protein